MTRERWILASLMQTAFLALLVLAQTVDSDENYVFKTCNVTKPGTWLRTIGRGLLDWGHSGRAEGPSFCITGCYVTHAAMVTYDVQVNNQEPALISVDKEIAIKPNMNACDYNDTAIQYCLAFCPNVTLKNQAIAVALSVRQPSRVAELIAAQQTGDDFVAVVLQVNPLAEPEARLIADVFLDPSWCSIYIYIQSTGFPYLFEMQMTRVKT